MRALLRLSIEVDLHMYAEPVAIEVFQSFEANTDNVVINILQEWLPSPHSHHTLKIPLSNVTKSSPAHFYKLLRKGRLRGVSLLL